MWHRTAAHNHLEHALTTADVLARLNATIDRLEGVYEQISERVPAGVQRLAHIPHAKDRR